MPLRDIRQYHLWIERESPSAAAQRVALDFLVEVGEVSWQFPSVPIAELSNQPENEVREAALRVEGEAQQVYVWYRHYYATDVVDVIAVTNADGK